MEKIFKSKIILLLITSLVICSQVLSQKNSNPVRIDKNGRMVWKDSGKEAFFWGVNYTTPFAHAYRQIPRLGEDHEKVIDIDTYHLARLGINAYRIELNECKRIIPGL